MVFEVNGKLQFPGKTFQRRVGKQQTQPTYGVETACYLHCANLAPLPHKTELNTYLTKGIYWFGKIYHQWRCLLGSLCLLLLQISPFGPTKCERINTMLKLCSIMPSRTLIAGNASNWRQGHNPNTNHQNSLIPAHTQGRQHGAF